MFCMGQDQSKGLELEDSVVESRMEMSRTLHVLGLH